MTGKRDSRHDSRNDDSPATPADAAAIAAIYNQGIAERIATFETGHARPRRSARS